MAFFLVWSNGSDRVRVPSDRAMTIGRDNDTVDIVLQDDRVSRLHMSAQVVNGLVVITDLGSSNGTVVNGAVIRDAATAPAGSVIEVGGIALQLVEESSNTELLAAQTMASQGTPESVVQSHPVFQTILEEAVDATQATAGWLLALEGRHLLVLAVTSGSIARVGQSVAIDGARGLALAIGQTSAQRPPPEDQTNAGAGGAAGIPTSVLAAPCGDESTVGVLEVVDKQGNTTFGFDDVELLTSLASIAGSAINELNDKRHDVTAPARIAAELTGLADTDPVLYRDIVRVIEAMLGRR